MLRTILLVHCCVECFRSCYLNKLFCFFGYISVTTDPPEMASHWDLSSWSSFAPRKRYLGTHCRVKDGALPLKPSYFMVLHVGGWKMKPARGLLDHHLKCKDIWMFIDHLNSVWDIFWYGIMRKMEDCNVMEEEYLKMFHLNQDVRSCHCAASADRPFQDGALRKCWKRDFWSFSKLASFAHLSWCWSCGWRRSWGWSWQSEDW